MGNANVNEEMRMAKHTSRVLCGDRARGTLHLLAASSLLPT